MNDPNPDKRVSKHENLGSAGSPHSTGRNFHQHSTEFEDSEGEFSPAHCETCGASIPPIYSHCPDHRQSQTPIIQGDDYTWSISHTAIAIVGASSKLHAIAKASAAFKRRDGSKSSSDSFDLIYDFATEPSKTLTSGWGKELPDATKLNSDLGQELYNHAKEKTDLDGDQFDIGGEFTVDPDILGNTSPTPFIYTEYGEGITEPDDVQQFNSKLTNSNQNYWIVPAVLYKHNRITGNKPIANRECPTCGVTQHVFDRYENGHPSINTDGVAIWVCLECDTESEGPAPRTDKPDEPWNDEDYNRGDRYSSERAENEEHNRMMGKLEEQGELKDPSNK